MNCKLALLSWWRIDFDLWNDHEYAGVCIDLGDDHAKSVGPSMVDCCVVSLSSWIALGLKTCKGCLMVSCFRGTINIMG